THYGSRATCPIFNFQFAMANLQSLPTQRKPGAAFRTSHGDSDPSPAARKGSRWMDSDRPLIRACLAGDRQAWETLIRRYQRLLYAIPIRCGLSEDDAADVFQTVCVRLLENLEKLR